MPEDLSLKGWIIYFLLLLILTVVHIIFYNTNRELENIIFTFLSLSVISFILLKLAEWLTDKE